MRVIVLRVVQIVRGRVLGLTLGIVKVVEHAPAPAFTRRLWLSIRALTFRLLFVNNLLKIFGGIPLSDTRAFADHAAPLKRAPERNLVCIFQVAADG